MKKESISFTLPLSRCGIVFLLEDVERPIVETLEECLEVFKRKFNEEPEVLESEKSLYEDFKASLGAQGEQFTWRGLNVLPSSDLPEGHLFLYFRSSENENWGETYASAKRSATSIGKKHYKAKEDLRMFSPFQP